MIYIFLCAIIIASAIIIYRLVKRVEYLSLMYETVSAWNDFSIKQQIKAEKTVEAYREYNKLLSDECGELVGTASVHGWKSTRVEQGVRLRDKIKQLEK